MHFAFAISGPSCNIVVPGAVVRSRRGGRFGLGLAARCGAGRSGPGWLRTRLCRRCQHCRPSPGLPSRHAAGSFGRDGRIAVGWGFDRRRPGDGPRARVPCSALAEPLGLPADHGDRRSDSPGGVWGSGRPDAREGGPVRGADADAGGDGVFPPGSSNRSRRPASRALFTLAVIAPVPGVAFGWKRSCSTCRSALGAFFAGVAAQRVGRPEPSQLTQLRLLQDAFVALFFVSVADALRPARADP